MNLILLNIGVILIIVFIITWNLFWSPMARSTKELVKLNKIWDDFNINKHIVDTTIKLKQYNWKYHTSKVESLKNLITLYENGNNKNS